MESSHTNVANKNTPVNPHAPEPAANVRQAPKNQTRNNLKFDRATCLAFLRHLMDTSHCTEFRIKGGFYKRSTNEIIRADNNKIILGGWFDAPDLLANWAAKLRGVSGYVTVNPA